MKIDNSARVQCSDRWETTSAYNGHLPFWITLLNVCSERWRNKHLVSGGGTSDIHAYCCDRLGNMCPVRRILSTTSLFWREYDEAALLTTCDYDFVGEGAYLLDEDCVQLPSPCIGLRCVYVHAGLLVILMELQSNLHLPSRLIFAVRIAGLTVTVLGKQGPLTINHGSPPIVNSLCYG